MPILVNLVELDPPKNGGTAQVAQAVAQMLQFDAVFVVNRRIDFPAWIGSHHTDYIPHSAQTPIHDYAALQPELIVSPLFGVTPFESFDTPHITQVPDTLALDKPALFKRGERAALYANLKHASQIVTISDFSRERLQQHTSHPDIRRIYLWSMLEDVEADTSYQPPTPYVLYPANTWPHKRHALLLQAMQHIWQQRPDLNLVLTGGRVGKALDSRDARVHDLGYVTPERLKTLYRQAEALLFTSEYEGFGMPLVEAMANGCPVICAPLAALPEIAGDAAHYVHSDDPQAWAEAFFTMQRAALIEHGYARARQFTKAAALAQWMALIREVLPAQVKPVNPETVVRLTAANLARRQATLDDLHDSPLKTQLAALEKLRRDADHPFLPVRLLKRLVYAGRLWKANAQLQAALIERVQALEQRLDEREQNAEARSNRDTETS